MNRALEGARFIFAKDNAGLARVIARMKKDHELARRIGHINATGLWLKTEDGRTVIKYSPELD